MTPLETVKLARLVKAIAPAQAFDEFTTDAWHPLLEDLPASDCAEAVKRVGRRQTFIAPADIRAEVRVIRRERLDHADATFVPDCDPDDTAEFNRQLLDHRRAIGDGAEVPETPRPIAAPKPRELDAVFRRPPSGPAETSAEPIPLAPRRPISEESRRKAAELLAEAARAQAEGRDPYASKEAGA
jgi:hypothetical protein